jgi:hypothetical protein
LIQFKVECGPRSKTCNGEATRRALAWSPRHTSFTRYMRCTVGGEPVERVEVAVSPKQAEVKAAPAGGLWLPGDDDDITGIQL